MTGTVTKWGRRAAALYDAVSAERYRERDASAAGDAAIARLGAWIGGLCDRFGGPVDVLELGCGTGRYFPFVRRARLLVGVDVSRAMLAHASARQPGGAEQVRLVEADFLRDGFDPGRFDLVFSIGVLAEHSPFDARVAARIRSWLRPGGRFAFTAVDVRCPSVPRTVQRRVAEHALPYAGPLRHAIRTRLLSGGLYADRRWIEETLARAGFRIESLEPFDTGVHQHFLTVAESAA